MSLASVYVSDRSNVMVSDDLLEDVITSANYLGAGVTRRVYDLGDGTVLKVNKNRQSYYGDCASEARAWEELRDDEAGEHLAPVLAVASDGTWLVMVKAESDGYRLDGKARRILERAGIDDLHPGNIGKLSDGRLVAIDYALNTNPRASVSAPVSISIVAEPTHCSCSDCRFNEHRQGCCAVPAHCDECKFHLETLMRPQNQGGTAREIFCDEHPCFECHDDCSCDDCFAACEPCDICGAWAIAMVRDLPEVGRVALCADHAPEVWERFTNPNKLFRVMNAHREPWFIAGQFESQRRIDAI